MVNFNEVVFRLAIGESCSNPEKEPCDLGASASRRARGSVQRIYDWLNDGSPISVFIPSHRSK